MFVRHLVRSLSIPLLHDLYEVIILKDTYVIREGEMHECIFRY